MKKTDEEIKKELELIMNKGIKETSNFGRCSNKTHARIFELKGELKGRQQAREEVFRILKLVLLIEFKNGNLKQTFNPKLVSNKRYVNTFIESFKEELKKEKGG